jgi:hypothetical protein
VADPIQLRVALGYRRRRPHTPLDAHAWQRALEDAGLGARYPRLVSGIRFGFSLGIRKIEKTFSPPNGKSLLVYPEVFESLARTELDAGRWIGPVDAAFLERELGPFHSSPISLVEKARDPEKPDAPTKFRMVQNFSAPRVPRDGVLSINATIDITDFPCTWGTPGAVGAIIAGLPPGSEMAIRDVEAAYRSIPLHPDEWPGAVVRLSESSYAIDTSAMFGNTGAGGCYGGSADAGSDILRWRGIGPLAHWVDDHGFFRILRKFIAEYNKRRAITRAEILARDGTQPRQRRGRIYWEGADRAEGGSDQHVEDMRCEIRDLAARSPRSAAEARFSYCMADIDAVTDPLGYRWVAEKDKPFAAENVYMGLLWNVQAKTVSIPEPKREKYLAGIREWLAVRTHTLAEAEVLHGRLQHITYVIPRGRAYLGCLQTFMGLYSNGQHHREQPLTPPKRTPADLRWWERELSSPGISRPIPGPVVVAEVRAFSDASSGIGVAVVLGDLWRAWRLLPGWKSERRDIQWAEAIGFELLCHYAFRDAEPGVHLRIWGDNMSVVEGWWRGRSANPPVNDVFRRLADFLHAKRCSAITRYVASATNPADDPSRGVYGPGTPYTWARLLPPIPIPEPDARWLVDFNAPISDAERAAQRDGTHVREPKRYDPADRRARRDVNDDLEREAADLASRIDWIGE